MLTQEGGCTLEELLAEDDHCVSQCRSANSRLVEFMCQRKTLQKLVEYATQVPSDEHDHDAAHKFPFVAADILSSSKTITQALLEGGWEVAAEEEDAEAEMVQFGGLGAAHKSESSAFDDANENKMVQSILKNTSVSLAQSRI